MKVFEGTCENCAFAFVEEEKSTVQGHFIIKRYCRRYPPTVNGFPRVEFFWFCGEYQEGEPSEVLLG